MDGSTFSALGAAATVVAVDDPKVAADFFKVLTMSLIKLIRGLLLVANALVSNCKNASMRNGSLRSIRFLMLSKTVFMLINVAGEGGDCDLEVGLDDPPVPRYIAADAGLNIKQ